jgi:hypothetical protein
MEKNESLGRKAQPPARWSGRSRGIVGAMVALAFAGSLAISAQPANADYYYRHYHHHGRGAAVVGGLIGGLALGALLTGPHYYYDGPYYDDAYYDPPPPPPSAYCRNYKHVDWKAHVWIDEHGRGHPCL